MQGQHQSPVTSETERQQVVSTNDLPVSLYRDRIVQLIAENAVLVLCGETGSGKSTQVPQYLLKAGMMASGRKLAISQPRRIAATSLAARVALELNSELGDQVGYSVRFDHKYSPHSVLKYVTNGMLIREFLADPNLKDYGAILIDEAHERTIETDVLLGLAKQLLARRPDFKVIVSSATLDADKISRFFDEAPILQIEGRTYPVEILYNTTPTPDYMANFRDLAAQLVFQVHTQNPLDGDVLVFLPGQSDIEAVETLLGELYDESNDDVPNLVVVPIYANMVGERHEEIFIPSPKNCRKVVLATNIAETSLTIPNIKYVVDSGLVKEHSFSPLTGMDTLETVYTSQASARQRAGRAGRTQPGICYRMYSKTEFLRKFPPQTKPEIDRSNLSQVSLLLMSLGIEDILRFPWIDPPISDAIISALQRLYSLGAVNQEARLTKLGRLLAEFPLDPRLAKALIYSHWLNCVEKVATAAAMLGEMGSLYILPRRRKDAALSAHRSFHSDKGDHFALLSIHDHWIESNKSRQWCQNNYLNYRSLNKANTVRKQLLGLVDAMKPYIKALPFTKPSAANSDESFVKAMLFGYYLNIARLSKNMQDYVGYHLSSRVNLHPSSTLFTAKPPPKYIIYQELVVTSKAYIRGCLVIDPAMLMDVAPYFSFESLSDKSYNDSPKSIAY